MAQILFLHGASSSGKTTLAHAVLAQSDRPMWHLSIDHFRDAGVWDMAQFGPGRADWPAHRAAYFEGFHAALGAIAEAGNDILLEHILDTPGWDTDLTARFAKHDVFFVGLITAQDHLARRERARGDRPLGSAVKDAAHIHEGRHYDLVLDGTKAPGENARKLIAQWQAHAGPSEFFRA